LCDLYYAYVIIYVMRNREEIHEKNGFIEVSKHLDHRSENNFVEPLK